MLKMNLNKIKFSFQISFLFLFLFLQLSKVNAQNIQFTPEEKEWMENHPVIKFGYEPRWLPFEIYENGEYKGIVGDYVKILERETGISFQPIPNITWEETVKGLKLGEIDFTMCAGITEERKEYLNFTKAYISSPMIIITRKGGDFIGGLEDLQGKIVSLPENYYTTEVIGRDYPKIMIDQKPGIEEAIRAVSLGESEAFVGNLVVASYYIEHMGYSNLKVAAPTDYEKAHIGLGARKDWPELISISQKVFDNIGFEERNAILQKWMAVRYEYGVDMAKVRKYAFYSGLIISIVFIVFFLWNKSLKREIEKRKVIEKELELSLINTHKKSEERKVLLQEIHHRVKNNLQIIVSLLRLQQDGENEVLEKKLNETIARINTISLIHEKVYLSDNLAKINLSEYLQNMAEEVIVSFAFNNPPELVVSSDIGEVDVKPLVPLALILNELLTNSLKYGVKDLKEGKIEIIVEKKNDTMRVLYSDNGTWKEPISSIGFGQTLIEVFTEQLEGTYTRTIENGTSYEFVFEEFNYSISEEN